MLMGKTIRFVEGRGEELEKMLFFSISFWHYSEMMYNKE